MSIKIIQTQFFISTLCALFCPMFLNWNAMQKTPPQMQIDFLNQLQGAVYRGMGGSSLVLPMGQMQSATIPPALTQ